MLNEQSLLDGVSLVTASPKSGDIDSNYMSTPILFPCLTEIKVLY